MTNNANNSLMLYISLRQYEYIVAVAEAGSLTRAAERLNVSQPSLSVAITRVEERLGALLFVRRKGSAIEITPYGHRVIERARDLLNIAGRIEQGPEQDRPFVVGCFQNIAPWYLVAAVERLQSRFPTMTFRPREGRFSELATDLSEGLADVVISYDIGFAGKFERQVMRTISPVAFLSSDHPLASRSAVELAELVAHPLVLFDEDLSAGFVRDLFGRLRLSPNIKQRVTSLEMMRSLAAHGFGIGISYSCPPGDISYDGRPLVTVPISTPEAATDIVLLWSRLQEPDPNFSQIVELLSRF